MVKEKKVGQIGGHLYEFCRDDVMRHSIAGC
jgi:hypothetical protein